MIIPESIDIEEYLQNRNIRYSLPGSKNVGRNSIGISCPFCGDHQETGDNHLGIKIDTKQWNCWICGQKGSLLKLITKLERCTYQQAEESLKPFAHSDMSFLLTPTEKELRAFQGYFKLPSEAQDELLLPHRKYLESRGLDPEFIYKHYNLKCVGPVSKRWKNTLIAPVYYHYRLVSFLTADITRQRKEKYKNLPIEESLIPINQTLYNFDRAKDIVLVVEGISDVWNIGDGSVALYRKYATGQQLRILKGFSKVFIMLDPDALKSEAVGMLSPADKLAQDLAAFTDTEIIELDNTDPGGMKKEDVKHLRREIFGH